MEVGTKERSSDKLERRRGLLFFCDNTSRRFDARLPVIPTLPFRGADHSGTFYGKPKYSIYGAFLSARTVNST